MIIFQIIVTVLIVMMVAVFIVGLASIIFDETKLLLKYLKTKLWK